METKLHQALRLVADIYKDDCANGMDLVMEDLNRIAQMASSLSDVLYRIKESGSRNRCV